MTDARERQTFIRRPYMLCPVALREDDAAMLEAVAATMLEHNPDFAGLCKRMAAQNGWEPAMMAGGVLLASALRTLSAVGDE